MSWRLITDGDERFDYAALLKNNALYDLRIKARNETISVGDVYSVAIERYHPALQAYSVVLPSGEKAHLPKPPKNSYQPGHFIAAQVQRLKEDDKDTLFTTKIAPKDDELSALKLVQTKKLRAAPDLATQLRNAYPNLNLKKDGDDFDHHDIWPQIEELKNKTVTIKDGVSLTIEHTTALTAIDVNSTGQVSATKANIMAASEIARQIRLRNIGGIILIDFINMREKADQQGVKSKVSKAFADDPYSTTVYDFTALGLVEISRKRVGSALSVILD